MPISRSQMERQLRMGGGIMGLEPRQQFLFGGIGKSIKKAVKGVSKGIKSLAKSDLGKAALLAAGGYYLGGLGGATGLGRFAPSAMKTGLLGSIEAGTGLYGGGALSGFMNTGVGQAVSGMGLASKANLGILGASALSGLFAGKSQEEVADLKQNPAALRGYLSQYYRNLNQNASDTEVNQFVESNMTEYKADGGRIGYAEGSEDMILPMRKPETEEMMFSNPGAAESGNPISRNNPVANLIDKYNTYKKAMPGVADETKTYLIEDFKKSLENSDISIEEFMMRLEEDKEMRAEGGRIGYAAGTKPSAEENTPSQEIINRQIKQIQQMVKMGSDVDTIKQITGASDELIKEILGQAKGGRIGYAFGTDSPENNAIQAAQMEGLPLNQNPAGVTELDLRDSGGFIPPVGVKEKADDIPAMLANNEFVFTADAVRGMGEGNVNKGAQRMYDMMKKLENGGRV